MSSRNIAAAESLKKVHQSCGGHLKFQLDKISLGRSKNKFWSACSSSSSRYFCCSSRCWCSWCSWWRWSESSRVEKPDFKGRKIKRVANYFLRRWNWFGVKHAKKENASHGNLVCVFGGGGRGGSLFRAGILETLPTYQLSKRSPMCRTFCCIFPMTG